MENRIKKCEDSIYRYLACRVCKFYGLCTSVEYARIRKELADKKAA